MDPALLLAQVTSILVFLAAGASALFGDGMAADFERFGLARFRRSIGALQVLGSLGLLVGIGAPWAAVAAATGLSLLMAGGIATRVRVRDPVGQVVPAVAMLLVNLFILVRTASS